jgi:hypothetical protein
MSWWMGGIGVFEYARGPRGCRNNGCASRVAIGDADGASGIRSLEKTNRSASERDYGLATARMLFCAVVVCGEENRRKDCACRRDVS